MALKAVLLDLDDTLVHLDVDLFTRRYVAAFTTFTLARFPQLSAERFRTGLGMTMPALLANRNPLCFNSDFFGGSLSATLELPALDLQQAFTDFHGGPYAELKAMAMPTPGGMELIEQLLAMGLRVVVATNPLYDTTAIYERLRWAGIDPSLPTFVTTADNSHFIKPTPHYYEEILGRLGLEPEESLMVGDSLSMDMAPAASVGMWTFHARGGTEAQSSGEHPGGTLNELARAIADGWPPTLPSKPGTVHQLFPRMLANVAALHSLTVVLTENQWRARPDPDQWSPLELVCHMRDRERTIDRPVLMRVVSEDNPFIAPPPTPPGPGGRDLSRESGEDALHAFAQEREETLAWLSELPSDAWNRPARHAIFGPSTLLDLAFFTSRHDRLHLAQLGDLLIQIEQI